MVGIRKAKPERVNRGMATVPDNVDSEDEVTPFSQLSTTETNSRPVEEVREQIRTVIDLMGPKTPPSCEGDNEDSVYSASICSVVQVQQVKNESKKRKTPSSLPSPQVSEISAVEPQRLDPSPQRNALGNVQCSCLYPMAYGPLSVHPATHIPICFNGACIHSHLNDWKIPSKKPFNKNHIERRSTVANWFRVKRPSRSRDYYGQPGELYKMNVEKTTENGSPPTRLVFDLIDDTAKHNAKNAATNTKNAKYRHYEEEKNKRNKQETKYESKGKQKDFDEDTNMERVDVYYFDHGNSGTTDSPPPIMTEVLAERTENYTSRFWAEIFGTIHIGISFVTSFLIQFFRFILYTIVRPLTVGLVQLASDYFFKPCLAVVFNGIVQPPLIFLYNVATSIRDLCDPLAEGIGYFLHELSVLCRSIRLISVNSRKELERHKETV